MGSIYLIDLMILTNFHWYMITMKLAMRLLLLVLPHQGFLLIFQKIEKFTLLPSVDRTPKIGSPDFKLTYIRLIKMKHIICVSFSFFPIGEIHFRSFYGPDPEIFYPSFNELLTVRLQWNLMYLISLLFIEHLFGNFYLFQWNRFLH